jgi:aryl-alcohol dehydrogenase-like predicted oxidoreductase/enamine deaminase RidA (YjgF/YER057c/UK114 family)
MAPLQFERRALAPGLEISRVVTGLWQIADMERDGRAVDLHKAAAAMQPYVDAGFTTFDMADHYGSAEDIAGIYGGTSVQRFTKWVPQPGPISRVEVRTAVQRSLDRLRTSSLDLLQFHAWRFSDPRWLDCLFYLQELKAEGLIRHLGVTNFDTAHLRIALTSGIELVSNQVSFSLIDQRAAGRMSALCREHGVQLLAYGTVAGGLLTEKWLGAPEPRALETWSQMKYGRFVQAAGGWEALQRVLRATHAIAGKHGEREHLEDNARVFGLTLDADDRRVLGEALATLAPIPGDCGDEYRKPPFLTASGDLSHHIDSFPAPYEVRKVDAGRSMCFSGTPWEPMAGYSRALRSGKRIAVSGTTSTHGARLIGGSDPAAQAHFAIDKIEAALQSLGGRLEDVVRTRIFVKDRAQWEPVARAHGERFGAIQPANTLVEAKLIGEEYLVEIEADAELP